MKKNGKNSNAMQLALFTLQQQNGLDIVPNNQPSASQAYSGNIEGVCSKSSSFMSAAERDALYDDNSGEYEHSWMILAHK